MAILHPTRIITNEKPWGTELVLAQNDSYVGKLLHLRRGESVSRHYHTERRETLYLLSGTVLLTLRTPREMQVTTMARSEAYHIPPGLTHWLEAVETSEILEITSAAPEPIPRLDASYARSESSAP